MRKLWTYGFMGVGLLAAVGLSSHASAQATLPVYDPFNYTADAPLVNGTNGVNGGVWAQTGTNATATTEVQTGSLSYSGLPSSTGNKVRLLNGSGYIDPGMDLATSVTSGIIYASAIVNVVNEGTSTNGDYYMHVSPPGNSTTDFRARLFVARGSGAGKFKLGIRTHSSDAGTVWDTNEYNTGTPVFVVLAYELNPGTGNDKAYLYVNPPLGQSSPPATPTVTGNTPTSDPAGIGRINLRQGGSSTAQIIEVDELRVSTSWTDVTPAAAAVGDWSSYK